jgi:hypothetical protein
MSAGITRREGDVIIERGKWVYVVRHVRGRETLVSENWWDGTLGGLVVTLSTAVIETIVGETSKNWKVGVLRYRTGLFGRIRVVFKERLPDGEDPAVRVQELVESVNRGEFDVPR